MKNLKLDERLIRFAEDYISHRVKLNEEYEPLVKVMKHVFIILDIKNSINEDPKNLKNIMLNYSKWYDKKYEGMLTEKINNSKDLKNTADEFMNKLYSKIKQDINIELFAVIRKA